MPRRSPPTGFILLGLMLAGLGAVFTMGVIWSDDDWTARLLAGGVAILSFLAAEALWWMRPWLGRIVDAWALACTVAVIASVGVTGHSPGDFLLLVTLVACFVGMPCALVRWYVRGHAAVAGLLPARRAVPRATP